MKAIFTYIILILVSLSGVAQNFVTKNELRGNWSNSQIWINNSMPVFNSNNQNISIDGTVTFEGSINLKNNNTLTLNAGDTLVVTGDFILNQNSDIIVNQNAVFTVIGNFTSSKNLDIRTSGIVVILGDFTYDNTNNGSLLSVQTGGNMYIAGTSNISNPELLGIKDVNSLISDQKTLVSWFDSNYETHLPIELESISAKVTSDQIEFIWVTKSETNNDFFTLEYSYNGIDFLELANIEGSGTTSFEQTYSYTGKVHNLGYILYYRLKQTDFNGNFTYSEIKTISIINLENNIIIKPNSIEIHIENNEFNSIEMYNQNMQKVTLQLIDTNTFDTSNLTRGVYFITVNTVNGTITKNFIK